MGKCHSYRGGYRKPKFYYKTQEEAVEAAERTAKSYGAPMKAYPCNECDFWHVGAVPAQFPNARFTIIDRFGHMLAAAMRGKTTPDLVGHDAVFSPRSPSKEGDK